MSQASWPGSRAADAADEPPAPGQPPVPGQPPAATAGRRTLVRTAIKVTAGSAACALTLTVAFAFAGPFGLVIAAECLAVPGLLILLARAPRGPRTEPVRLISDAVSWATRGWMLTDGSPQTRIQAADFPAYLKISSDLSWASLSIWHYDHGTRPLFRRVIEAWLAAGHQPDQAAALAQARRLIGDDLWPLVDPYRAPSQDSRTPGPDLSTLTRIVDRLEQL